MTSPNNLYRYILAQPWFAIPGHPAQSLVRTYRAISPYVKPEVWVYVPHNSSEQTMKLIQLSNSCNGLNLNPQNSWQEKILHASVAGNHLLITHLLKLHSEGKKVSIFLLDTNLHLFSLLINLYKPKVYRLDILCMVSPDFYGNGGNSLKSFVRWYLVKQLFKLPYFYLHLRTEELAEAWKDALPDFSQRIGYLPSLELQGSQLIYNRIDKNIINRSITNSRNFSILGQIRPQKSVEDVFNIFCKHSSLGNLTIAGKILDEELKTKILKTVDHIEVSDRFLSESEMENHFIRSDYNLMLYKDWDQKMESAMLYESLKFTCPIVAYEDGWLGNRVKKYGLGWLIDRNCTFDHLKEFIANIPQPCSSAYKDCLLNLKKCYDELSSPKMVDLFLQRLNWDPTGAGLKVE